MDSPLSLATAARVSLVSLEGLIPATTQKGRRAHAELKKLWKRIGQMADALEAAHGAQRPAEETPAPAADVAPVAEKAAPPVITPPVITPAPIAKATGTLQEMIARDEPAWMRFVAAVECGALPFDRAHTGPDVRRAIAFHEPMDVLMMMISLNKPPYHLERDGGRYYVRHT